EARPQAQPPDGAGAASGVGVGNLSGIIEHLDHLQWLGIDAVWLSPIYVSPMADFGYDVSDFCDVDARFGSLTDVDELLIEAHARGIRVILDWVPNHTSNQHPWFVESRRDRTNPKANWYVWRDAPANNWMASFPAGEPAWSFDEQRGQYYLRSFLREQPDLNWDEPDVEEAMLDTLRFWLDRGVDGFRMDVVHLIAKDIDRDDPPRAVARGHQHVTYNDVAAVHPRLRRIRAVLDSYPGERVAVGEVYLLDEERMAEYYGAGDELHLNFNFAFLWAPFDAAVLRTRISSTLSHLAPRGAWPTWVLSNHDVPRHRTRYGGSERNARLAAVLLLTLPGTPFMYQGEELGLLDAVVPAEAAVDPGGRDGCRAPIPWDAEPLHGWSAEPWLPFPPESDVRNVADARADEDSIVHLYRRLLALRRSTAALHLGGCDVLDDTGDLLAYTRYNDSSERWVVAINISDGPLSAPAMIRGARVVVASDATLEGSAVGQFIPAGVAVVAVAA
ncbi:MAG: alpha-amylase family glycosyl hydrolase, partial [Ilumatobacteraceae bacterium]